MHPQISVVVPTFERPEALMRCLEALALQTLPQRSYEVIVVDDGSSCELEGRIAPYRSRLHLTLLRQENKGPAAARNLGINAAQGQNLAFTDDDCEPRPAWLATLNERLASESDPCLVGGRVVNLLSTNLFSEASHLILEMVYKHYNVDPTNAHFFASMNIGVAREKLLECGSFDTRFRTAEDRELCDRWRANGYRLVYEPEATIGHAHLLDFRHFCKQHYGYGRGADHYHRVRGARASGTMLDESSFHLALPGLVLRALRDQSIPRAAQLTAILFLWQVCNLCGFLTSKWNGVTTPDLLDGQAS